MGGGEGERGYILVWEVRGWRKVAIWKVRHGGWHFCWALYSDRPGVLAG